MYPCKIWVLTNMKIDNYKLYEYAYNELPSNEIEEVENYIANNPEALKTVNEYLNLKQNLDAIPTHKLDTSQKKSVEENSIFNNISQSLGRFISLDFRPNLAFAALLIVGGIGFLQIQTPQNPLLNEAEITQYEVYFAALKKDLNPTLPQTRFTVKVDNPEIKQFSSKKRTQKNTDDKIVTLDPCEEITLIKEESNLIVKLCPSGDQWKVTEQRLITP